MTAPPPVIIFDEIDSTNEEAARRARAGVTGPIWFLAHRQTAGRGRRGRDWSSVEGNLFATCLVTSRAPLADLARLSFAAAVALAETCDLWIDDPTALVLKWPNDLLLSGAKVSGILLESGAHESGGNWVAVGVGLNIASAPQRETPTAALAQTLRPGMTLPTPEAALAALAPRFSHWSAAAIGDFEPLRMAWLARCRGLNGPIRVQTAGGLLHGTMKGLAPSGALALMTSAGLVHVSAGDVFFG